MTLLYERISTHLLEEIRRGALGPGDRVPSETELAERFQVSRITSKRALEVLREAGLVQRVRGKGSFVVRHLPDLTGITLPPREPAGRLRPRRQNPTIALVVPDLSETYGLELLYAVEERCTDHGVNLMVRRTHGRQSDEEKAVDTLVGPAEADGLIVFPVHGDYYNASLLRQVLNGYPMVLVDRQLSGIAVAAVHTDNVAASRALTERLLDRGHEQLAFVSPPPLHTASIEDRLEGFRSAIAEHGRTGYELSELRSTLPGSFTPERVAADLDLVAAFQRDAPDITAYIACEYNLARLLDRALDPDHEATVACFDSPSDPIAGPRYLHVRQDQREMGRRAVDLLLAQLRGESIPNRVVVPFALVDAAGT